MDYRLAFWAVVAFWSGLIVGNISIYVGPDEEKYNKATWGILTNKK